MGRASKDKRDIFYRLAKEQGWRARSAFKLLQAHEQFNLLDGVTRAVDLCAAPGGWSQVLAKYMYEPKTPEEREQVKIIAVDMQGMAPIEGVTQLREDITKESTATAIIDFFGGQKAQLVVSDGAPDITGMQDWDNYMQAQLLLSALSISTYILEEGGTFMGKVYRAANTSGVYLQLKRFFKDVCVFKPSASRNSSIEAFVVCRQFCMPEGHVLCNLITEWHNKPEEALRDITGKAREDVVHLPFVAHQSDYDADLSYELDEDYNYHEAVQKPLTAAYQDILEKTSKINIKYDSFMIRHDEQTPAQEQSGESGSSGKPKQKKPSEQSDTSSISKQTPSPTESGSNDQAEQSPPPEEADESVQSEQPCSSSQPKQDDGSVQSGQTPLPNQRESSSLSKEIPLPEETDASGQSEQSPQQEQTAGSS